MSHATITGLAATLVLTSGLWAEIIVPDDLPLGAAISLAADGETITIMPGVYDGSQGFVVSGKAITLRSFSGDPADTVIDGFAVGRILEVTGAGASGTRLEGLTFRNGNVDVNTTSTIGGAAVRFDGCDATIQNCLFEANVTANAGGDTRGGAVDARNGNFTVLDSTFRDNFTTTSGSDAGALNFDGTGFSHVVAGCVFDGNGAVNSGGAMRVDHSTAQITSCLFVGNDVGGDADARGGAFFARLGATVTIDGTTFRDNTSSDQGGAIGTIDGSTSVTFRNSIFQRNMSTFDGGAINSNGQIAIVNCTFEGNTSGTCAVLCTSTSAAATIDNSILWNNQPNANQLAGTGSITVGYSIVQSGFAGVGVVDADPMFAAAATDDLTLLAGSPAIDAGGSSRYCGPFVDLAGNDRAVDDPGVADTGEAVLGPVIDMGAYEHPAEGVGPSCPGDLNGDGSVSTFDLLQLLSFWGECL